MRHKLRHLILILLMLTLGLQSSWAAVASLCLHEVEAQAASHLGHHAHAHQQADAADADTDADAAEVGDAKQTGPHADCATCHAGCGALFFPAPSAQLQLPAARVITPYQRSITLGLPERLIRPPHCFLA